MGAPDYDSAALLTGVRRDCFLAASDENWTDARIMSIADDCTLSQIAPVFKSTKQDWFQADKYLPFVASVTAYDLPEEAMWSGVDKVWIVETATGRIMDDTGLNYINASQRGLVQTTQAGIPTSYWTNQTQIVVNAPPDATVASTYELLVSYYRRPAQLVLTTNVVTVTAVSSVTLIASVTTIPTYMTTNGPDTYTSGSPYRLDVWDRTLPNTRLIGNATASSGSSTLFTFNGDVTAAQVALISAGDIISVHGTSKYPDMPPEAMPFLRKLVGKTITMAQKDDVGLQAYIEGQQNELSNVIRGMSNRADGSPKKLSMRNAGALRVGGGVSNWWRQ